LTESHQFQNCLKEEYNCEKQVGEIEEIEEIRVHILVVNHHLHHVKDDAKHDEVIKFI
jgi:hypothetical protein